MAKTDTTVKELVELVKKGELRLPEMQRRYVWTSTRVRDLLDSLYRRYPSGTILVWETDHDAPARDLSVQQQPYMFSTQKLLLDGQQRVTSLCAVLNGEPISVKNNKRPIEILFNLAHPEGPPVELTEVEDDTTDDEDEMEESEPIDATDRIHQRLSKRTFVVASKQLLSIPTWIKVSDIFRITNDHKLLLSHGITDENPQYELYSERLQKVRAIQEYPYVMQVLDKSMAYEEVAEIFVRVNSLGIKLKGSDLAMAQVTARWKHSLRLFEDFSAQLEKNSSFQLDTGLLLRMLVICATKQSRFKTVQSISTPDLQNAWEDAKRSIHFAINFLRLNADIENESLLSSSLIILATAFLARAKEFKLSDSESQQLLHWVRAANVRGAFSRGSTETILDQYLTSISKTASVDEMLNLLRSQVTRLLVEPQDFVGRGAGSTLFATVYLALKARDARDWLTNISPSLSLEGKSHKIEYHHIFPKSLLNARGVEKAQVNEIANFAFISGKTNRWISNREPGAYLPELIATQGEGFLDAHLLPRDPKLWQLDSYPDFLQWRRERLSEEVNKMIGTAS